MNKRNLVEQTDAPTSSHRSRGCPISTRLKQWLAEELALLRMREKGDQYLVSAAMGFKQKVDLLIEIFPRPCRTAPESSSSRSFGCSEKHSMQLRNTEIEWFVFYAVECGDSSKWVRIKGSLRSELGFYLIR